MKEFFAVTLCLFMLFSFGIHVDLGDSYEFPTWVNCMLYPERDSAIDMTIEPLYQFSKIHIVPIYEQLLPIFAR